MGLQLALYSISQDGRIRILGRTSEPNLVDPVRLFVAEAQIESLKHLGHPALPFEPDSEIRR